MKHVCLLLLVGIIGCTERQAALPANLAVPLEQATGWELISIDPGWSDPPEPYPAGTITLHGYPVIGRMKITEDAVREKLLAELQQAAVNSGSAAACFAPRHMLRVEHDGQTVDLLICFPCNNASGYIDGKRQKLFQIAPDPKLQESLNQLLAAQKIPLAQ